MIDVYYDYENDVLKNKLGITNKEELENAEADILSLKINKIELATDFSFFYSSCVNLCKLLCGCHI